MISVGSKGLGRAAGSLVARAVLLGAFLSAIPVAGRAEPEALRRTRAYEEARALHRESPGRADRAWSLARACFDRCEVITSKRVRISLAREAVEACRSALDGAPSEAGCHYYLGLNLGILAECQPLKALGWVREMESAWLASRVLDPGFDHAGADRSLGMLYAECPPPPLGVGSRGKARLHLARAVEVAPGYPENRLQWIEFLLQRGEADEARKGFQAMQGILPEARSRFSGPSWEGAWRSWESRITALEKRLGSGRDPVKGGDGS